MNVFDVSTPYKSNQYRKSGVYAICDDTGLCYIGSTRYLGIRTQSHMAQLRHNYHTNDLMQANFNLRHDLSVRVIEECPADSLRKREQHWIDTLQSYKEEHGFNLQPSADGKAQGERTKQKLRIQKLGDKNGFFGKTHSDEQKKKYSKAYKGAGNPRARKVVQRTLDGTVIKIWDYIKQAATELGISKSNISSACAGRLKTAGNFRWEYFSSKAWLEV